MLMNYLTVAFRNLVRNRVYSAVNILGLAVGIAFCILTFLFVRNEWTYDAFHETADRIYRIVLREEIRDREYLSAMMPDFMGPALAEEIPEIERFARLRKSLSSVVRYRDRFFTEEILFADASFLNMFSFPLVRGNAATALQDRHSVVVTEDMARKVFGQEDPLGKVISIRNFYWDGKARDFRVTGVARSAPENSSIQFGFLVPIQNVPPVQHAREGMLFSARSEVIYVRLSAHSRPADLREKLAAFLDKYRGAYGQVVELQFQPLADVHLTTQVGYGLEPTSSPVYSYMLSGIALAVLLIACVNFTNLSIGRSSTRAREVGVRKVVGAMRTQLMRQFWVESILTALLSFVLGIALAEFFLPAFNGLVDRDLSLDYRVNASTLIGFVGVALFVGLAAGGYPAVALSGLHPVDALKSRLRIGGANLLGRLLVVLQFSVSVLLIICMSGMSRQVRLLRGKDLGFRPEQVAVVSTSSLSSLAWDERSRLLDIYRDELTRFSGVVAVSGSDVLDDPRSRDLSFPDGKEMKVDCLSADYDFLRTLGIRLVEGRNFSPDFPADETRSVVVNETFVRRMGLNAPVGQTVPLRRFFRRSGKSYRVTEATIVGVVGDFHYQSLYHPIRPMALLLSPRLGRRLLVRISSPNGVPGTLDAMRQKWQEVVPGFPFEVSFLDEHIDRQYRSDEQWQQIVEYAAMFAIFVACLGAFGLTTLAVTRRTKEIGIRKALGASVSSIVGLLSREFLFLVAVSNVIAWPVAWYAMGRWLRDFAYRIELGPGVFLLGSVLALLMVILTVGFQAVRSAMANPVDALRHE